MEKTLRHRGPDDNGVWLEPMSGVAFGHTRLAIQDISSAGHQPMISQSGRYVTTYNGEIYNFLEIRAELSESNHVFHGNSDTEVLLASIEQWGLEKALKRFVGMFAFAVWDRQEKNLHLARDRIGEKPLYYGWLGNTFAFASELKALRIHPAWNNPIDRDALTLLLRHNYIPTPYSIYQNIKKLEPGTFLNLQQNQPHLEPIPYWSARDIVGQNHFENVDETTLTDHLENLLKKSIANKMIADVPLGAFLSGGVDSSTVVALMQSLSPKPVNTFTIGFHERDYNEAHIAKRIATHLGTNHTELYVRPQEMLDVLPKLPELYDEPFSDSSQIPTYLVSAMTREHVTVALSGDGGDELFGGYNRYFYADTLQKKLKMFPRPLMAASMQAVKMIPPHGWDKIFKLLAPIMPKKYRVQRPGEKIHKLAEGLKVLTPEALYLDMISHWKTPADLVLGSKEPRTLLKEMMEEPPVSKFTEKMMYWDLMTYLPDDILTKVDRASMGVSLEMRVPYLDHNIVEFAWALPLEVKVRRGQGKCILKEVLNRYVPNQLTNVPKRGFGVPLGAWLSGPLKSWCEELLSEQRLIQEGFFNPAPIRQLWEEHQSGKNEWHYPLWNILMFQAWYEKQG